MRRSRRPAAAVVSISSSSSDQEGRGSDSDDFEEEEEDVEEEEEEDDSDDEDYIDSDCDDQDEDETASSREEEDEENAVDEKPNDDERCRKVVQLLTSKESLDALKVEECKSYLRKYGLRISGNKTTCINRILEHWRLKDGNSEILYPQSSFVINCTGDVCKGDVVLFRQRVYDKFDKVRRRANEIGKRTIAGRVVKESYGAAKQQHTFTIEVLWSRGKNALPPMFALLVKGRNLYRLKTFRQPWSNELQRSKVLAEKHQRGAVARYIRKSSKAMSMKDSRCRQGSSSNARLNYKKRGQEEPKDISRRKKQKVASGLAALDANANNQATWTRNASLQKIHYANTSTQANTDTVARNFDPSYDVQKQAINHGVFKAGNHIPERKKQKVASAFAALDADANNQFPWTRNIISQQVPNNLTRNFHPSYDVPRQAMNHGCRIYRQGPVSPRNPFYIYNTHSEIRHPNMAPPQTNQWNAYIPSYNQDCSFGMAGEPRHVSNTRHHFHLPYASVTSSVEPWSQQWRQPDYGRGPHFPRSRGR
ncbi:zinc finger CCCH domain-containing protein 62-like isoform X1 [Zingiber officinale]|uniref:zinc finger CCCH domain-containing protein 62-like isoform X1 n=1 Tax=Zingiber officinale TaxID=94328 RepID=UPI001C4BB0B7|nr:zinc finger CCCH domain-containing protein 62-like isoform X1 [Zingiber officinale]